jgi:hypothetical protein
MDEIGRDFLRRAEAGDSAFAVAYAVLRLTHAVELLGTADAATPMGAIEMLAVEVKGVAKAIDDFATYYCTK